MPCSGASRISCSTLPDSRAPSAEVGSSRITIRRPKAIARAHATAWRWPPDISPISAFGSGSLTCRRSISSSVSLRIARSSTQPNGPSQRGARALAAREEVADRAGVVEQREVLEDRLDPQLAGVVRRVDPHRLAVEPDLAVVGLHDAREDLDQRRLAGAVVAEQREDLALAQLERDVAQRGRRAVLLARPSTSSTACRRARPRSNRFMRVRPLHRAEPLLQAAPEHVELDRDHDDHADHDQLQVDVDVEQVQPVGDHAEDQHADDRAADRAAAAPEHAPPMITAEIAASSSSSPADG